MKAILEKLENDRVKLEIEVDAERVETALQRAYRKVVRNISVPGFRKGRVPRPVLERMFGVEVLYEDAIADMVPEAYSAAVAETKIEPIDQPDIDVIEIAPGKPFRFTAEVQLKPEVKLGEYKGIPVTRRKRVVTDKMVEEILERYRESQAQLVDVERNTVEMGDYIRIDFEGYKAGVPFSGGAGKDVPLEVGSGTFIAGFEEQLVGATVGEEVEVNVTFPDDYHVKELAGQPATFKVTVNSIKVKELPELDDELARDVSEYETLDELRASIRQDLEKEFERRADELVRNDLVAAVAERAEVHVPHVLIHRESHNMAHEFLYDLAVNGISPEAYLSRNNLTFEDLEEQFEAEGEKRAKYALVIEAVAEAEGIKVSDEEIEAHIEELVGDSDNEELRARYENEEVRERLASSLLVRKVIDFLVEHADITEEVIEDDSEAGPSDEAPEGNASTLASDDK